MNPELRRNLWLEISTHRLIAAPLLIALFIVTIVATADYDAERYIANAALGGFLLFTMLWGSVLASNSISDEFTDRTWDWQRLSALQPWAMTLGKLLGSTVFAWYGGLLSLLVFLATATEPYFLHPYQLVATLVLGSVMLHAGAMASALQMLPSAPRHRRRPLLLLLLALVLIGLQFAGGFFFGGGRGGDFQVRWYGSGHPFRSVLLASAAAFAAWAVLGAYRSMCQALMVRRSPVAWLLFMLFLTAYSAGFGWRGWGWHGKYAFAVLCAAGSVWGLLFSYIMLFTEQTGPQVARRIAWKARLGEWHRVAAELPCWPLTWLLAALCAIGYAISGGVPGPFAAGAQLPHLPTVPLALVLLAARDAGILLYFLAAPQPKRALLTTVVYIFVLSGLLPMLLHGVGAHRLAQLLSPIMSGAVAYSRFEYLLGPLLQAVVALALAWRRMRSRFVS